MALHASSKPDFGSSSTAPIGFEANAMRAFHAQRKCGARSATEGSLPTAKAKPRQPKALHVSSIPFR